MKKEDNLVVNLLVGSLPADKKGLSREEIEALNKELMDACTEIVERKGYLVNKVILDKAASMHLHQYNQERVRKWNEKQSLLAYTSDPDNIAQVKMHAVYVKELVMDKLGKEYFSLSDMVDNCDANNFATLLSRAGHNPTKMGQFKAVRKFIELLQAFNFIAVKMDGKREMFTVTMEKVDLVKHVDNIIEDKKEELNTFKLIRKNVKKDADKEQKIFAACEKIVKKAIKDNKELVKDYKATKNVKLIGEAAQSVALTNSEVAEKLAALTWPDMEAKGLLRIDGIRIVWDNLFLYAEGKLVFD